MKGLKYPILVITANETINEQERLKALEDYAILDTLSEIEYDNITSLAAQICQTKISLISLIDNKRQWFKSKVGISVSETPKEYAFCAHAINSPKEIFIVEDARKDIRFHDNPMVTGQPNIVFYAGIPLETEDGFALGTLCVLDDKPHDLTESQLDALRVLSNHTLALLALRKKKKELEQSLLQLQEKNAKLENFAMIAAHDIKSPIRNILSLSTFLLEDHSAQLDTEGIFLAENIKKASIKLNDLINALLQYAKSDKAISDNPSAIHLTDFCNELKAMLIGYENFELIFNLELETIYTNLTALTQILLNLISNAAKYNFKPHIKIEISITVKENEILVSVKDNGEGIDPAHQEKIFDMFKILTNKDRFGKKGNGIGLAIVKEKIELLGGKIWLESTPKIGTTFYFTLKNQVSV